MLKNIYGTCGIALIANLLCMSDIRTSDDSPVEQFIEQKKATYDLPGCTARCTTSAPKFSLADSAFGRNDQLQIEYSEDYAYRSYKGTYCHQTYTLFPQHVVDPSMVLQVPKPKRELYCSGFSDPKDQQTLHTIYNHKACAERLLRIEANRKKFGKEFVPLDLNKNNADSFWLRTDVGVCLLNCQNIQDPTKGTTRKLTVWTLTKK